MTRISYALAELPPPANMPAWAAELTKSTQGVLDSQYLHGPGGLDNFYDQAQGWLDTQTMIRSGITDPAHYIPTPFAMKIPQRQVATWDENGLMGQASLPADPNIHLPQLPDWIPPSTAPLPPIFGGTHPPSNGGTDPQVLAGIMIQLLSMQQKLDALLVAVKK